MNKVRIKFDKLICQTPKAICIKVGFDEHWIPIKLCSKLRTNNSYKGSVSIPDFIANDKGLKGEPDELYKHHIPSKVDKEVVHDTKLFK
jgi:hypothetical protein